MEINAMRFCNFVKNIVVIEEINLKLGDTNLCVRKKTRLNYECGVLNTAFVKKILLVIKIENSSIHFLSLKWQ